MTSSMTISTCNDCVEIGVFTTFFPRDDTMNVKKSVVIFFTEVTSLINELLYLFS